MTDSHEPIIGTLPEPRPRERMLSTAAALLLLIATGALVGRFASQLSREPTVAPPPNFVVEKEAAEQRARQHDLVGKFATGAEPGDRVIEMTADGRIRFYLVGPLERVLEATDRYQIGSIDRHPALATKRSGVVEIVDIDRLKYFDDTYQRAK